MRKVGELELFSGEDSFNIYSDDFEKFYKDKSIELTKEELEVWSTWLNSPWSQTYEKYITGINCRDGYTKLIKEDPIYRTYYQVVGYEYVTAIVYGYGNTTQESVQDCINHFEYLQKTYNKENISI